MIETSQMDCTKKEWALNRIKRNMCDELAQLNYIIENYNCVKSYDEIESMFDVIDSDVLL